MPVLWWGVFASGQMEVRMGVHDQYGKKVLEMGTRGDFKNWFQSEKRSFEYPTGGIRADLDGLIGEDCVVEVTAVTEKQMRGAMLDLAFHPRRLKLLVVLPEHVSSRQEGAYQRLMDCLIDAHCKGGVGKVVVLKGTGRDPETHLEDDCEVVRQAVKSLFS